AVIAGGMPGGQLAGGAEEVGDGAAAGGEDRRDGQDQEALIGGVVEDRSERGEDGLGEVGYNEHEGHLVEGPWGVGLPLSFTRWSDLANSAGPLRIPSRGRSQPEGAGRTQLAVPQSDRGEGSRAGEARGVDRDRGTGPAPYPDLRRRSGSPGGMERASHPRHRRDLDDGRGAGPSPGPDRASKARPPRDSP